MSKVIFMEKGEPNLYSVIKNGNWLMAVQHNGEQGIAEQRENMRKICNALSDDGEPLNFRGTVGTWYRDGNKVMTRADHVEDPVRVAVCLDFNKFENAHLISYSKKMLKLLEKLSLNEVGESFTSYEVDEIKDLLAEIKNV